MDKVAGQKILAVFVLKQDQSELVFQTERGYLGYTVEGDCCSSSWFADITGVQALLGQTVNDVESVEMADVQQDDRSRQEFDRFYGYKLKTPKGHVDIVFRNSSNGYYGGMIDEGCWYMEGRFNVDNYDRVTDDWSA